MVEWNGKVGMTRLSIWVGIWVRSRYWKYCWGRVTGRWTDGLLGFFSCRKVNWSRGCWLWYGHFVMIRWWLVGLNVGLFWIAIMSHQMGGHSYYILYLLNLLEHFCQVCYLFSQPNHFIPWILLWLSYPWLFHFCHSCLL